jgi:hypothetical protein
VGGWNPAAAANINALWSEVCDTSMPYSVFFV